MYGIILCSGYGKKLWPFTDWQPKCCIPVANEPLILRTIKQLEALGLEEIIVVASENAGMIRCLLRNSPNVHIVEESKVEGTAKSLLKGLKSIEQNTDVNEKDFLVVYGDVLVDDASLEAVVNRYKQTKQTVVLTKHLEKDEKSLDWMCAKVQDEEIKAIYGHPRSHYVNKRIAGVFAFSGNSTKYLSCNPGFMENVCVGTMPPKQSELEQSLQMMLEDGHRIIHVEVVKYSIDVDKPWHILEANHLMIDMLFENMQENSIEEDTFIDSSALIEGKIRLGRGSRIGKNVVVKGNVFIGENTVIDYGAILEGNIIIGDHTSILDTCMVRSYTTIGNKNKIGYNADIQGVTFDGVAIVHGSEIFGIIGSYVDIGAGCLTGSLRFDDTQTPHKIMGRTEQPVSFANAVCIGDHSRTGVGNIFLPGVKVGIQSALWPGAIIDKDVASNTMVIVQQNQTFKWWGPEKYGW